MKTFVAPVLLSCLFAACSTPSTFADPQNAITRSSSSKVDPAIAAQFARYEKLALEPTPESWKTNSTWKFVIYNKDHSVDASVKFRLTDLKADTCMGGDWKQLEPLGATSPSIRNPAYMVEGRNLLILLSTGLCDAYDQVKGELGPAEFHGKHFSSGLFGGTDYGDVFGEPTSADQ